jgi:PAS domain S-box-containing protein
MNLPTPDRYRILVADDEEDYLKLYEQVFSTNSPFSRKLDDYFEPAHEESRIGPTFELSTCRSGDGAVALVKMAIDEHRPFSVAFLDIRMPPGPDGIWAAKQIRQLDPFVEIVIVTGFSDYSPRDILARIPPVHKLIYIQKPFRLKEIFHFANVLSAKRYQEQHLLDINKTLEWEVAERTRELEDKNRLLTQEIQQRIQAQEALRKSERSYRLLVEKQMDLILKFDRSGKLLFVSPSYAFALDKTREELIGKTYLDLVHAEERAKIAHAIQQACVPPHTTYLEEKTWTRHGWRWYSWVYTGLLNRSGQISEILAVGRDIMDRKQTELDLRESQKKLQVLFSHLVTAQEEERKRIASDLHDDLGQTLALLKLRIQSIQNRISPDQAELVAACGETVSYVNQIINQVRRLSHDLSPAALNDLGLADALKALANDYSRHTQTRVIMDIDKIDRLLPPPSEVIIYRVFQEVFTNIQKHSHAREVCIRVERDNGNLQFEIKDGGKGFDVAQIAQKSPHERGLGLSSIDERIRMLGGQLTIDSCIGKGTCIAFSVPCR